MDIILYLLHSLSLLISNNVTNNSGGADNITGLFYPPPPPPSSFNVTDSQYPIFEEFRNFIYYNLEALMLVASPIAILVLFIGKKINDKIKVANEETDKTIIDINERIDDIEKELKEFVNKYDLRLDHSDRKVDEIYKSLKTLELEVISELKVIKVLLNQNNNQSKN